MHDETFGNHDIAVNNDWILALTFPFLPHLQLFGELRYNQKGLPALALLRLQDVAKDVISHIEDVLTYDAQEIANNV